MESGDVHYACPEVAKTFIVELYLSTAGIKELESGMFNQNPFLPITGIKIKLSDFLIKIIGISHSSLPTIAKTKRTVILIIKTLSSLSDRLAISSNPPFLLNYSLCLPFNFIYDPHAS